MDSFVFVVLCVFYMICVNGKKQTGLQIIPQFMPESCSQKTAEGDVISVHYTGSLESGQVFDSSVHRGEPFSFTLGQGKVIKGWDAGLLNMCIGEKRKLIIPPQLGYGSTGAPPTIPPDATLIFETELMGIENEPFMQTLARIVRFLGLPVAAGFIVYYLYSKYKSEVSKSKEKEDKRGKKKRR